MELRAGELRADELRASRRRTTHTVVGERKVSWSSTTWWWRSLPRISSSSSTAFVSDSEFFSGIFFIANLVPEVRSSTLNTSLVTPAPSLRPRRYALSTS